MRTGEFPAVRKYYWDKGLRGFAGTAVSSGESTGILEVYTFVDKSAAISSEREYVAGNARDHLR